MAKRALGPYESERVSLRLLGESDLPMTLAWRNQDEIRRWFFTSDVISPEQHRAWFEKYRERDDDFVFVIEARALDGRPVGQVSLYHVDWENGTAEYGRLMIGDAAVRGTGLARAATERLVEAAFADLRLGEIVLEVIADNAPAIAIYQACGFVEEARDGRAVRMARRALGTASAAGTTPQDPRRPAS